jgi:ElaB/YqjD/DUF883 family membrane-anchored ribosome-binding protein
MNEQEPRDEQEPKGPGGSSFREDLTELYESMSRVFRDKLEQAGTLSEEAFERALHETRDWAGKLKENYREHYAEDISRVAEFIRRDWHEGIRYAREQYRRSFDLDRLQTGAMDLVARLARIAGAQLEAFAARIHDRLTYKTGEIAGAGTLQCNGCGQTLAFDKATRIPPCPKCRGTSFRRSF